MTDEKKIRLKNTHTGPLHLIKVWDEPKTIQVVTSRYKKEGKDFERKVGLVKKDLHESFRLLPGELSEPLPERAARSDQIIGLHKSGMIRVFPI